MKLKLYFILFFSGFSTSLFCQNDYIRSGMFFSGDFGLIYVNDTLSNESKANGVKTYGFGYQYYTSNSSKNTGLGFRIGVHFGDLLLVRLGSTYNFGKGRIQFPIGILGNIGASVNNSKFVNNGAIYSLEPMIGIQYYFNNRFYVQGEGKYFWGVQFVENEMNDSFDNKPISGLLFNVRLGFNFSS